MHLPIVGQFEPLVSDEISNPDYVVFASFGNDSIALLAHLVRKRLTNVVVAFSDTGWAHPDWGHRVAAGARYARTHGMKVAAIPSKGMRQLVIDRKGWPMNGKQFCTSELKILPALSWLDQVDPEHEAVCAVGVRRAESRARAQWPEWEENSDKHGGRSLWAPLVRVLDEERDRLVQEAGFDVLPHRSKECWPCVNSNRADLRTLTEERVAEIAQFEEELGYTSKGKPRTMFRPAGRGGAVGIREVKRWADADRGKYEPPTAGCDGGWCGT